MIYFTTEICILLYQKRIKSQSGKWWWKGQGQSIFSIVDDGFDPRSLKITFEMFPAYTFEDLLNERNAMNIWGDELVTKTMVVNIADQDLNKVLPMKSWEWFLHLLLHTRITGGDWQQVVLDSLKPKEVDAIKQ